MASTSKQVIHGLTETPKLLCDFTWTIKDFNLLPYAVGNSVSSAPFRVNGLPSSWYLKLYPNGNKSENEGQISIFLHFKNADTAARAEGITVRAGIAIVNTCGLSPADISMKLIFTYEECKGRGARMTTRSHLLHNSEFYLPGDTLTVKCSMEVVTRNAESSITLFEPSAPLPDSTKLFDSESICQKWAKLLEDGKDSDFTLKVQDSEIPVHKFVLSVSSSVLETMLRQNLVESETNCMEIEDFSYPAIHSLVKFMYCGKIDVCNPVTAMEVYKAAHKYDVKRLLELCTAYLCGAVNVRNVLEIMGMALLFTDAALLEAAKKFVVYNLGAVRETDGWNAFYRAQPELVFELFSLAAAKKAT